jgi:hypothetical protein
MRAPFGDKIPQFAKMAGPNRVRTGIRHRATAARREAKRDAEARTGIRRCFEEGSVR